MTSKDLTYRAFVAMLRNALWARPIPDGIFPLDPQQWDELLAFSRKQGVLPILFDAIDVLPHGAAPSPVLLASWLLEVSDIERFNARLDSLTERIARFWKVHGVTAVLLKGQQIAHLYPVPAHRACGDIDWYFPTVKDWDAAREAVIAAGAHVHEDSDGDIHYRSEGVTVEHHRRWNHVISVSGAEYLRSMETGYDEWRGANVLSPELNIVMLSLHILKHAMVLGVGFRQLCDLAMAYRHYKGRLDAARLQEIYAGIGLARWADLIHTVLRDEIGMPEEYLPFPIRHRVDTRRFISQVVRDGNLGMERTGTVLQKLGKYLGRTVLFIRYAPREVIGRNFSLFAGRLKRNR